MLLRWPTALAIGLIGLCASRPASADLLIDNVGSNSILRYNTASNTLTTFSNGDNGALKVPHGMTYGPDGNLYVSSLGTGQILEYNGTSGAYLGVVVPHTFGSGNTPTSLEYPNGIAFDPNNSRYLYIASFYNNEIDRWDTVNHTLTTYAKLPSTVSNNASLHVQGPTGLSFGFDGNLYVNDSSQVNGGSNIRVFNTSAGDTVGHNIVAGFSDQTTGLNAPAQFTFTPYNGQTPPNLIETKFFNNEVDSYKISFSNGQYIATFDHIIASLSSGGVNEPGGVAYDPTSGRVLITNYLGNSLLSASIDGSSVTNLKPTGVALNEATYIISIPIAPNFLSVGPFDVPEPTSVVLLAVGSIALLGRQLRRRRQGGEVASGRLE